MNTRGIKNEKKEKSNNIKNQIRQKWIPKSSKNTSSSNNEHVTQELNDTTIST